MFGRATQDVDTLFGGIEYLLAHNKEVTALDDTRGGIQYLPSFSEVRQFLVSKEHQLVTRFFPSERNAWKGNSHNDGYLYR